MQALFQRFFFGFCQLGILHHLPDRHVEIQHREQLAPAHERDADDGDPQHHCKGRPEGGSLPPKNSGRAVVEGDQKQERAKKEH